MSSNISKLMILCKAHAGRKRLRIQTERLLYYQLIHFCSFPSINASFFLTATVAKIDQGLQLDRKAVLVLETVDQIKSYACGSVKDAAQVFGDHLLCELGRG